MSAGVFKSTLQQQDLLVTLSSCRQRSSLLLLRLHPEMTTSPAIAPFIQRNVNNASFNILMLS